MAEKWYVAKLLMQSRVAGDTIGPWTCDEQVRVLRSVDDDSAYQKAVRIGHDAEDSYQNTYGQTVTWEFVGVAELDELIDESIQDGTEITSRLFTHPDPASLVLRQDQPVPESNKPTVGDK